MTHNSKRNVAIFLLISILIIPTLILLGFFTWYKNNIKASSISNTQPQTIIITKGQSMDSIISKLETQNLIKNPLAFRLMLKLENLGNNIQAGSHKLDASMTAMELVKALSTGTDDVWVTIPEGLRKEEIAQIIGTKLESEGQDFDTHKFIELSKTDEGYLFPDTYLVPLTISANQVHSLLKNTFESKVVEGLGSQLGSQNRSLAEIITMASIIEREARTDKSRKMVSGILWKRLANDWPLQVDATLQYAKANQQQNPNDWWPTALSADKEIDSPYNSYMHSQLPPGPIASPSLSSIKAALSPTESDYWYYITGNDGEMYYGESLDDHNSNIRNHLR